MQLNLNATPEEITINAEPILYIETHGPFMEKAGNAWQELHRFIGQQNLYPEIKDMLGFSLVDESKLGDEQLIYRASVTFSSSSNISGNNTVRQGSTPSGKYLSYLMTGSYEQFPEAFEKALALTKDAEYSIRNDFFAERYLNMPNNTKEEDLKTEIWVPIV